ncbi:MAG TPA: hypothetical protein VNM43_09370 [Dehalococcoidia bacterium]|nr:hypothetical protein [Dehalococcoidia bacterium]
MTERPLTGRRVLFLGAEGPHGRRIAVALGEAGASVELASLSCGTKAEFTLHSIANEFWAFGGSAEVRVADLLDTGTMAALADASQADTVVTHVLHGPGAEDPRTAVLQVDTFLWRLAERKPGLVVVQVIGGDPDVAGYSVAAEELVERTRRLSEQGRAAASVVILDGGMPSVLRPLMPQERFDVPDPGDAVVSAAARKLDGLALYVDL